MTVTARDAITEGQGRTRATTRSTIGAAITSSALERPLTAAQAPTETTQLATTYIATTCITGVVKTKMQVMPHCPIWTGQGVNDHQTQAGRAIIHRRHMSITRADSIRRAASGA